jgi:hypothetical protein
MHARVHTHTKKKINTYRILVWKPDKIHYLENLGADRRIILKLVLGGYVVESSGSG